MIGNFVVHTTYQHSLIIGPFLFVILSMYFFYHAYRNQKNHNKLGLLNFSIMGLACLYAIYNLANGERKIP